MNLLIEVEMKNKLIVFFVTVTSCFAQSNLEQAIPRVTIFVHGTHLGFQKTGEFLGRPSYKRLENGLHKVADEYCKQNRYGDVANSIAFFSPVEFPLEHCYLFCWSGILSHEARVQAAQELDKALQDLVARYNKNCIVTLIAHSHGGNVALNLAGLPDNHGYVVDSLILLGTPVQKITQEYVNSDLFKNVFAFYSRWDLTQIGDLQKEIPLGKYVLVKNKRVLFSQRKFPSKKVKHIEVSQEMFCGNRPFAHLEFLFQHFTKSMATILKQAELYDFSSGNSMIVDLDRALFYDVYFGKK